MLLESFNHTIDMWIDSLKTYNSNQLRKQPSTNSWSIGQVYMHLIKETTHYLEQIKICIATNEHMMEEASPTGKTMFLKNEFPDEIIEGPSTNSNTPQPANKEQLLQDLLQLKSEMNTVAKQFSKSAFSGKTKHPGLNYFNAKEWLQFADMHLRHHLRQKKRIDAFLKVAKG